MLQSLGVGNAATLHPSDLIRRLYLKQSANTAPAHHPAQAQAPLPHAPPRPGGPAPPAGQGMLPQPAPHMVPRPAGGIPMPAQPQQQQQPGQAGVSPGGPRIGIPAAPMRPGGPGPGAMPTQVNQGHWF
jgi:hypothetical protein